jgi:putative N6-adenine-specific DNA methylase
VQFKCFDQRSLYKGASEIDWTAFIRRNQTFAIDANVHHRELRNSLFAAQVVKDVICDQMRQKIGSRPSVDVQNPDVQINLFIQNNRATISFDTSGAPLHKRGYRQESVEAPIQETLAAAILRLAHYQGDAILWDPCCGSGTLLIEAALIATGTCPGYLRKQWGFMHHPQYDQIEWLKVRNQLDSKRRPLMAERLFGIDLNKNAVRASKINLKAAGFHNEVSIINADFKEYEPSPAPTLVVTNPPHGKRLEEVDGLRPLYRALGDFMKRKCVKPSLGYIFTGNLELAKEVGLAAKRRYPLNNGGVDSRLLEFEIY